MNAHDKYWKIISHPAFINRDGVEVSIQIEPHMICPTTNRIEKYKPLNSKMQLWVEMIVPWQSEEGGKFVSCHDWELDCGGDTWSEAICALYDLVLKRYGDYTEDERISKHNSVYRIHKQTITAKSRKLNVKWNISHNNVSIDKWSDDVISFSDRVLQDEDITVISNTINALTLYRETCSIEEYDAVDEEIECEKFRLFEKQLTLETGIYVVGT